MLGPGPFRSNTPFDDFPFPNDCLDRDESMEESKNALGAPPLGQVRILPDDSSPQTDTASRPLPSFTSTIYEWTPSATLKDELPEGFVLRLRCVQVQDGIRRFYPAESTELFIHLAFTAGLAMLSLSREMEPEQRFAYRLMWFLFRRVRRMVEHLDNALLNATSLRLSRVARDVADERSILPETVGLMTNGEGSPWGVNQLLAEGRREAMKDGIDRPREAESVQYGLLAAARLNPLNLPAEAIPELVRQALYLEGPTDQQPDAEVLEHLTERTSAAVEHHVPNSAAEFDAWFQGPKNSLVRQIGQRKLMPGGRLEQETVRAGFLELGWHSYRYVADCIHTAMNTIKDQIQPLLTPAEEQCYEQVHLNQPHFGSFPLVLLAERIPFIKGIIWDLIHNPTDQQTVGVLHRLLDWYGDIARRRRQADRITKQRRPASHAPGEKSPLTVPLPELPVEEVNEDESPVTVQSEETVSRSAGEVRLFTEMAERICTSRGLRCACALSDWRHRVATQVGDIVTIEHSCPVCEFVTTSTLTLNEIRQHFLDDSE